jgi:hypothetical protein
VKKIVIFVGLIAVVAAACARHDDSVPPMLPVVTSPSPTNFTVATSDDIVWNLSWSIADPTVVRFYLVYTLNPFTNMPELADTAMTPTPPPYNTGAAVPGLVWGVSAVSTDNVESTIIYSSAP